MLLKIVEKKELIMAKSKKKEEFKFDKINKKEDRIPQGIRKYRTQHNLFETEDGLRFEEVFDPEIEPSQTVPGRSLTVREVLQQFTVGGEAIIQQPQYMNQTEENLDLDNARLTLDDLDKFEKMDLLRDLTESINEVQLGLRKKADADRLEKAVQKALGNLEEESGDAGE